MKLGFKISAILCVLSLLLLQCKDDEANIFRAYVEGKFTYSDGKFLEEPIHLVVHQGRTVASANHGGVRVSITDKNTVSRGGAAR